MRQTLYFARDSTNLYNDTDVMIACVTEPELYSVLLLLL